MSKKNHILSFTYNELKCFLETILDKPYRVKQILDWIYKKHIIDFHQMTNIPLDLRNMLNNSLDISLPNVTDISTSVDQTKKFLLKLSDNEFIEMVYMPGETKNTLCISSQVGCSRNCTFCATAKIGLKRNLPVEELLSQIIIAYNYFPDDKITNIVLMGMGEPLDNLDNVKKFIEILQTEEGFSFSGRRITVSTCGVIPKIKELADSGLKVKLAVSLNSAINEKRDFLMPINKLYPLKDLKKSLFYFRNNTAFRITFEYILISNYNMGKDDIKALIAFCGDISCKINLIKWNSVKDSNWKTPTDSEVDDFIKQLNVIPAAITLRKSRGSDINGACGQLAGIKYD